MDHPETVAAAAVRIVAAGRIAWPGVEVAEAAVAERLAARVAADPVVQLDQLHDADLYLALALAGGDPAALRVFEAELVPHIDGALRRLRLPPSAVDELMQALRFDLLVGNGEPKIADFAGRGELAGWLRVAATRSGLGLMRKDAALESIDDILVDHWPSTTPDPLHQHMRSTYTTELKRAIRESFAALEVRQRNLLRQHVLDEMTIDDLSRVYRVHRATCAQWLVTARSELGRGTRKRLLASLKLAQAELDSLLRFLDSDIELSISRILVTA